jgi:hypothetical protein
MSSSSFAPLAEAVPRVFRPFGAPPAAAAAEPAPAPGPSAGEIERAFGAGVERGRAEARAELETIGPPPLMTFLRGSLAALRASLEDVKDLELVEDPGLPAGGCVIESRFGEVDIGDETQLERALVRATE